MNLEKDGARINKRGNIQNLLTAGRNNRAKSGTWVSGIAADPRQFGGPTDEDISLSCFNLPQVHGRSMLHLRVDA